MALYTWTGFTEKGKQAKGLIDATSVREAKSKLRAQGVFVSDINEESVAKTGSSQPMTLSGLFGRVKLEDITVMTRQLSTLVGASIPLVEALNALYEQTENPALKKTLAQVKDGVNEGLPFADALALHKKVFPELYVNMVRSGEASGALDIVLLRLADFMESQHKLRSKVTSAMVYPVLLVTVSCAILFYLLTAVVPKVVKMFTNMGQALPLPTRILITISSVFGKTWWLLAIGIVVAVVLITKWKRTPSGGLKFDTIMMRLPLFGVLIRKVAVARFARTLGTLLTAGVPIIDALNIVKTVVQNKVMQSAIGEATVEVMEGSSIAAPLKKSGVFPPIILHMIAVGEKSGTLEEMLMKAAESYEGDVETSVAGLTSILEPVMILVMGGMVGFIVVAILFPMLQMSTMVK